MVMAYIEFKPHVRFQEFMLSLITQFQIFLVFMASILSGYSGDSTGLSVLLITTTVIVLILGVVIMYSGRGYHVWRSGPLDVQTMG